MSTAGQSAPPGTPGLSSPIYVAIDLETTGLQVESDEIIEVAAVKFSGSTVLETWQTLVCPSGEVSYRIHRLTGIRLAELDSAPQFPAIAGKLHSFIKNYPLVGHSVSFDISFLQRQGLALTNVPLDTFALAMLLLPTLPSYTLENVAIALGIGTVTHHRAMVDTVLAKNVFLALLNNMATLDLAALEEVEGILARARQPLADLFRQAVGRRQAQPRAFSGLAGSGVSIASQLATKMGVEQAVFSLPVASASPLVATIPSSRLAGAAERVLTLESEQALRQGLDQNIPLYCETEPEANSYLPGLSAILNWASDNQKRVIIAAGSPSLRQQLLTSDLPAFQRMQAHAGRTFSLASLEAPTSYLCLHRWFASVSAFRGASIPSSAPSPLSETTDPLTLGKFSLWLRQTTTGNRSELASMPQEGLTWEQVRAGETLPDPATCAYLKHGYCFVQRALGEAQQAQALVASHQVLFHTGAAQQAVLAGYDRLIVLEAHQLEEEATRQGSVELDVEQLTTLVARLAERSPKVQDSRAGSPPLTGSPASATAWLLAPLQRLPKTLPTHVHSDLVTHLKALGEAVEATQNGITDLFLELKALLVQQLEQGRRPGGRVQLETSDQPLRLTTALRNSAAWTQISECWIRLDRQAVWLDHEIEALLELLKQKPLALLSPPLLAAELGLLHEQIWRIYAHLQQALVQPLPDRVYWLRAAPQTGNVVLYSAPLAPGAQLQRQMQQQHLTPVFLSPLFSVDGHFTYVRERLGADENQSGRDLILTTAVSAAARASEASTPPLETPLAQPTAAGAARGSQSRPAKRVPLFIPDDIPEPNHPAYQDHLEQAILSLSVALRGQVVVLFTAHAALRSIYSAIKPTLESRDILVLGQAVDGSPRQLWQSFRSAPRVVLLGTGNLWDNLDAGVNTSLCLVLTRLPFISSVDPIFAARSERYQNAMQQYSIPQMALRLKHITSRLVAAPIWPACVVCLDHRLSSKDYGPAVLRSLPVSQMVTAPASHMVDQVKQWLKRR